MHLKATGGTVTKTGWFWSFCVCVHAHVCYHHLLKYFETIPNAYTEEVKIPALLHNSCPAVTPPHVTSIYVLSTHVCAGKIIVGLKKKKKDFFLKTRIGIGAANYRPNKKTFLPLEI